MTVKNEMYPKEIPPLTLIFYSKLSVECHINLLVPTVAWMPGVMDSIGYAGSAIYGHSVNCHSRTFDIVQGV